jgi:hypothetical protein
MSSCDNVIVLLPIEIPKITDKIIEMLIYHGFIKISLSYLEWYLYYGKKHGRSMPLF